MCSSYLPEAADSVFWIQRSIARTAILSFLCILIGSSSVQPLTREAVACFAELADRAPLAMVVDAFLMRAADDAVGHGDGQHARSTANALLSDIASFNRRS